MVFDPTVRGTGAHGDLGHVYWLVRRVEDGIVRIERRDPGMGDFQREFVPQPESAGQRVSALFLDDQGNAADPHEVAPSADVRLRGSDFRVGISTPESSPENLPAAHTGIDGAHLLAPNDVLPADSPRRCCGWRTSPRW